MCDTILILNLHVVLDEDEVADHEVSDPLELVGFETVLVFVPGAPVLTRLLGHVLDVGENQLLRGAVGVSVLP